MYLLFGEERFLVEHYSSEICREAEDKVIFDGAIPVSEIIMAAETIPFGTFSENRFILVRDSRLFAAGRKADSELIAEYLQKIPQDTIIIFQESEVDRRTRTYKKAAELGGVIECAPLPPQDLTKWLMRTAKKKGKELSIGTANHLLRTCGNNMFTLFNEAEKLIHYSRNQNEITPKDINEICTPTLESKIFDLTKAVGAGKTSEALKMYSDMLTLKESPIMVLTMLIRQLRIILLCKCHAEKNTLRSQISKELGLRDFMINEALAHGKRFTTEGLIAALENCSDTDIRIKTGLLAPEIGVEMLIIGMRKAS